MATDLSAELASLKIDRNRSPRRSAALRYALIAAGVAAAGVLIYRLAAPYIGSKLFKTEVAVTEIRLISPAQGQVELTSTGYVEPQMISNVAAKVTGKVAEVKVRQGGHVDVGDVLFRLEVSDQEAAIASARSRVASARARAQTARANLTEIELQAKRAAVLAERGVQARAQADDLAARVESLRQQVRAADAEVKAARAEVEALQVNLGSYTVTAPLAGTVLSEPPEVGEVVGPISIGATGNVGVIEIADFTSLAVETDVPEARLHLIEIGSPCEIVLDAFPGKRYRGEAIEIVPRVNRAKATVTVKVRFIDDADGVLPDMAARVSFLSAELDAQAVKEPPKLVVPAAALVDRSGAKVVFTVDDGKVRMVPVTVGAAMAGGFVLERGPPAGTRVVKDPPDELADGQAVKEKIDG